MGHRFFDEQLAGDCILEIGNRVKAAASRLVRSHRSRRPIRIEGVSHVTARAQMQQSMSRAGDCYDIAFMESCFGTIKTELEIADYDSIEQEGNEIREFVNFNNVSR